jgi:hypothetical protein
VLRTLASTEEAGAIRTRELEEAWSWKKRMHETFTAAAANKNWFALPTGGRLMGIYCKAANRPMIGGQALRIAKANK